MIPAQIIATKRDGQELTDAEIAFFVQGYSDDSIPDYQMSALAMAICLQGMTADETSALTLHMLQSGTHLCWPRDGISRVDKHSTGGVGDKVSIILAPLLAACGLQVPMLSGRGLGTTGGTLDKLEAIHGLRTDLTLLEIQTLTQQVGCVITGASAELAPADRRLYALRDVTGTVPSIPLITASIMSKKLAESPDALVLDVKFGSGALMKTRETAAQLARSLVQTGTDMGVTTTALLTDMNQPLGRLCGNAVEIRESIEVLQGAGPADVRELTIELAAELLRSSRTTGSETEALRQAARRLDDGSAFEKFEQMVAAQGGDLDAPLAVAAAHDVHALEDGLVVEIDTAQIGSIIVGMGGGRKTMLDQIDHSVGLEMFVRIGDVVQHGQPIARVFSEQNPLTSIEEGIRNAITLGEQATEVPLIVDRLTA